MESELKYSFKTDELYNTLINCFKRTYENTLETFSKEKCYTCVNHHEIWIELGKYIDWSIPEKFDSLLYFRYFELQKQLNLLHFNILSGSYHQSIRELRYILESVIQSYYIDKNHPNVRVTCKLEVLKEIDKFVGSRLIEKTDLKYKNELKELYSDLSKHVHSSYEKMNFALNDEIEHNMTFMFNERLFNICKKSIDMTMDAFFFIMIYYNTDVIQKIIDNKELLNDLSKNNYILTLKFIKKYDISSQGR